MIIYMRMNLFDAPLGSTLVHACNGQGVWGAGIAAEFANRFPGAENQFREFCEHLKHYEVPRVGHSTLFHESDYVIGSIITSDNFGQNKDSVEAIKVQTAIALMDFLKTLDKSRASDNYVVYSNKFNSGLFGVPWTDTEFILKTILRAFPKQVKWIVCDPKYSHLKRVI